jgi:isopentenyl phosphate kinase
MGVCGTDGSVIPEITDKNLADIEAALKGSGGIDTTGGMETKVRDMVALVQQQPSVTVRIFDGLQSGLLEKNLSNISSSGTLIKASK